MSLFDDASLVLIPDGAKDGKLYSVKPTDGTGDFTFTRSSNLAATRVDENGLIEKGRENLLKYSEEFDNPYYLKNLGTLTTNQTTAPDGSLTADLFTKTSGVNTVSELRASGVYSSAGIYTYSIYVKQNVGDTVLIRLDLVGNTANATFNFSTKTISTVGANAISATATELSDGWFRLTLTGNVTSTGWSISIINLFTNPTNDSVYVWGAQLENGLAATDYIETGASTAQAGILEDLPRIDYSGGASCPALLLEPQRTNLVSQSEYFGGSYWLKADVSITDNDAVSPDGMTNAAKLIENATTAQHKISSDIITAVAGDRYTESFFAKAAERNWIYLEHEASALVWFNLSDGTIGTESTIHNSSASIEDYGNGWYRCIVSYDAFDTTSRAYIGVTNADNIKTYLGDGSSGVYIYGAQLEAGSYPTSYIPTYGTSVTRNIDICIKTSATSLIGQTQGTFFIEFVPLTSDPMDIFYFNQTTSSSVHLRGSNPINARIRIGSFSFQVNGGNISVAQTYKVAVVYDESFGLKLFVNGVKYENNTPFTFAASLDTIVINSTAFWIGDGAIENKQSLVFPTALTDSECIALTTI